MNFMNNLLVVTFDCAYILASSSHSGVTFIWDLKAKRSIINFTDQTPRHTEEAACSYSSSSSKRCIYTRQPVRARKPLLALHPPKSTDLCRRSSHPTSLLPLKIRIPSIIPGLQITMPSTLNTIDTTFGAAFIGLVCSAVYVIFIFNILSRLVQRSAFLGCTA